MRFEFKKCYSCASKPGSPWLCEVCLHNRYVIEVLTNELKYKNGIIDNIKSIVKE